jgi:hypothetical protein
MTVSASGRGLARTQPRWSRLMIRLKGAPLAGSRHYSNNGRSRAHKGLASTLSPIRNSDSQWRNIARRLKFVSANRAVQQIDRFGGARAFQPLGANQPYPAARPFCSMVHIDRHMAHMFSRIQLVQVTSRFLS